MIAIKEFNGESPRIAARQLPDTMAQKAINCKLWSTLEPFRDVSAVITPTKTGADQSMYRIGQGLSEATYWMTWATDVDVVRGQIAGDTTERTYYTGDGVPKVTDLTLASTGGTDYPHAAWDLGLPKPTSILAPSIIGSGSGLPENRLYAFTFKSAWGEESAPSAVSAGVNILFGQYVGLSGLTVAPTGNYNVNARRIYRSNTSSFGAQLQFVAEVPISLSMTASQATTVLTVTAIATKSLIPGLIFATGILAGTYILNQLTSTETDGSLGGKGTYTLSASATVASTTCTIEPTGFVDTLNGTLLGEILPTATWEMPPTDLKGLIALPNGGMAGFTQNELCLCEPYHPYAWPIAYKQAVGFPIVAIGQYGGTIVVGTTGIPTMFVGTDPSSMTQINLEATPQACVSKRSMLSMGHGVCYASPDGLVYASAGSARLATENHFTRDEWQALNPSSIHAYLLDGRYIGFYDTGTVQGGFIFSPADGRDGLVKIDTYATSGYVDPVLDALYLKINGSVVRWDAHATLKKTLTWKSKIFSLPKPGNMSCGQVYAASYPTTMNVYADGVLKHTQTVADEKPFRLPSGFLAIDWELEIIGTVEIYSAYLAASVEELKNG